jgi:hypothetical protein
MYWCVAMLVLLITNASQAKAEPPDERALRLVNHYRELAGLTLVKLDQQLSAGCMAHANYMVQNRGTDALAGSMPTTSGCPAQAPRVRNVPRRLIYFLASPILASRSTAGWPACITAVRYSTRSLRVPQPDPQTWHRGLSDHATVSAVR